jgi:hypothetical protein
VDQIFHRIETEETNYKNVFLQPDHVTSKYELPTLYVIAAVAILWRFVQTFLKHSSPELKNVPQHFPADSHLKYSGTKTDAVEQCP